MTCSKGGGIDLEKRILLITLVFVLMILSFGCINDIIPPEDFESSKPVAEIPNTMPPSIMIDEELYSTTGEQMVIEPDESVIKTTTSVIKGTELPSKDGQINFPVEKNTKYAKINDIEGYVVVLMDSEWVRFNKREDVWGVKLTTTKVTPRGLTLIFNQSGGKPVGDLQTGSLFWLEVKSENQWITVEMLPSAYNVGWTDEAYIIPMNDSVEWEINWEWLYGQLTKGSYRIGKEIMDLIGTGVYEAKNYYGYFEIVENQ